MYLRYISQTQVYVNERGISTLQDKVTKTLDRYENIRTNCVII